MGSPSGGWLAEIKRFLYGNLFLILFINLLRERSLCVQADGFAGIPGSFCATRAPGNCCSDRNDRCAVPLMGTECYCDDFCDRRAHGQIPDCCPDFYEHCRGIFTEPPLTTERPTPPPTMREPEVIEGCWSDNTFYPVDSNLKKNCNQCVCQKIPGTGVEPELFEFLCESHVCLIQDDLIQRVNSNYDSYRWTAANYSTFYGLTLEEGQHYWLGTFKPEGTVTRMHEIRIDKNAILPDRFDARQRWPGLIHAIGDQGRCAASWAFSTAELASDRISILTRGEMTDALSPQHLLSCNTKAQKGCDGGHLDRAWWFLRSGSGIVTENCYPYRGADAAGERCPIIVERPGLTTVERCPSGTDERYLWQVTPPYRISSKEQEIKYEILTNGPVQAVFRVQPDFFSYQSGVYQALEKPLRSDPTPNYHSVRILGWGVDTSVDPPAPYWLCTNSWGTDWGEDGTFRIVRGQNEAEIESFVIGVWGKRKSESGGHSGERQPNRNRRHHSKTKKQRHRRDKDDAHTRLESVLHRLDQLMP